MTRFEFLAFIESIASFANNFAHAVVTDELWATMDSDSDGILDVVEFNAVSKRLGSGALVAEPIVVYSTRNIKYMYDFMTTSSKSKRDVCTDAIWVRQDSSVLPKDSNGWHEYYKTLLSNNVDPLEYADDCFSAGGKETVVVGQAGFPYAVPMIVSRPGTNTILLDSYSEKTNDEAADDESATFARVFGKDLELDFTSTKRLPDIIHVFDDTGVDLSPSQVAAWQEMSHQFSKTSEVNVTVLETRHGGGNQKSFQDDTSTIVKGAVMFPSAWTNDANTCGLFNASIFVTEVGKEGNPTEYKTDDSGWFELSLTRGKSFVIGASFPDHTICHIGQSLDDAVHETSCDDRQQNVTLTGVQDGNYVFFADTTKANVDLGMYQGECEGVYSGATFKITPINGCHAPIEVTSADIGGWMTNVQNLPEGMFDEDNPVPRNARVWPYAAMEYSILLSGGPGAVDIGDAIKDEWDCATESGSYVDYFRTREIQERLADMRLRNSWTQVRYKYHGFICVEILDIPIITDANEKCYIEAEPAGGLTSKHFLGTSSSDALPPLKPQKNLALKVFELHPEPGFSGDSPPKCFIKLPNEEDGTGSTMIKIRHTVSDPSDSACHDQNGGGPSCDFQVTANEQGRLVFSDGEIVMPILAGAPNLAPPYRRTIRVDVTRNDLYRAVTTTSNRYLIPLGSKVRGGADDNFMATVPLEGLVYTVVHDPPGGNSYAQLATGSKLAITMELSNSRSASVGGSKQLPALGPDYESKDKTEFSLDMGTNVGWMGEFALSFPAKILEIEYDIKHEEGNPGFSVSSNKGSSWDIETTTERTIKTSEDPFLAGRPSDVILGGAIELVYKLSDILDLVGDSNPCLKVSQEVTWLPRRPTSYVYTIHAIEDQVLPNLKFLKSIVSSGGQTSSGKLGGDESGLDLSAWSHEDCTTRDGSNPCELKAWSNYLDDKIGAWERTLDWSSPSDLSAISKPSLDSDGLFEAHLNDKMKSKFYNNPKGGFDDSMASQVDDISNEWIESALMGIAAGGIGSPALWLYPWQLPKVETYKLEKVLEAPKGGGEGITEGMYISASRLDFTRPDYDDLMGSNTDIYAWGANDVAASALTNQDDGLVSSTGLGEDGTIAINDQQRVTASFTGAKGPGGLSSNQDSIWLSFSGGGSSVEYAFTSDEKIIADNYNFELGLEGEMKNTAEFSTKIVGVGLDFESEDDFKKEIKKGRTFAWNKRSTLSTTYSLGDPEYGDKFVVHVQSDTRFGTPVFIVKGGRSKCPGETGTIFRESGVSLEIPLATKLDTSKLNPGQRAIFELVIKNESPYREGVEIALRIFDGLTATMQEIVDTAYEVAGTEDATPDDVYAAVVETADSSIAKNSPEVKGIKSAANAAKSDSKNTPLDVAAAVYSASTSAPREGTELADSVFTINGNKLSLGDYMPFKYFSGDSLERQTHVAQMYLNLAVEPGFRTRTIEYLQVQVLSLCELDVDMSRDTIEHTQNIDVMRWAQDCPKVEFDASTVLDYGFSGVSKESSSVLEIVVNNPDQYILWPEDGSSDPLINPMLEKVYLQYRPVSGGEWITAKNSVVGDEENDYKVNLMCPHSRTQGCIFKWNVDDQYEKLLSGFKDGLYEIRAKSLCTGGSSLADASVHAYVSQQLLTLNVDTEKPVVVRKDEDFSDRSVTIAYNEQLDCSQHKVSVTQVYNSACASSSSKISEADLMGEYVIQCASIGGSGVWMMQYPDDSDRFKGIFEVVVSNVKDSAGNTAMRDYKFRYTTLRGADGLTPKMCEGSSAELGKRTLRRTERPQSQRPYFSGLGKAMPWSMNAHAIVVLAFVVVGGAIFFAGTRFASRSRPQSHDSDQADAALNAKLVKSSYGATV